MFVIHLSLEALVRGWLAARVVSCRWVMVKAWNRFCGERMDAVDHQAQVLPASILSFSAQPLLTFKFKVTGALRLRPESSVTVNWCSKRSSSIFGPQRASVSRCTCGGRSWRSPENCGKEGVKCRRLVRAWLAVSTDAQEMRLNGKGN